MDGVGDLTPSGDLGRGPNSRNILHSDASLRDLNALTDEKGSSHRSALVVVFYPLLESGTIS
jgi:hypothetical protein